MSIDTSMLPLPKGQTRKQVKAKKDRSEAAVKKQVRAEVVRRDCYCRISSVWGPAMYDHHEPPAQFLECDGPSEWAHLRRRSQTRGMAPDIRHTTADTLMLCRKHHADEEAHRLRVTALTRKGCDGHLKFTKAKGER